jgi:dTDP-4-dehydrorhamnose 3,5-epimerase
VKVTPLAIPDVLLIVPDVFGDARGYFLESFNAARYRDAGIVLPFVQDNVSLSARGVLRGLHFQSPNAQGKLVQVLAGEVFDVAVDVRAGSPTFGRWVSATLSGANHHQLWLPPGFAHGFVVTSDSAMFAYKCTALYERSSERTIRWNDPEIAIRWPIADVQLSDKDANAPLLRELASDALRV